MIYTSSNGIGTWSGWIGVAPMGGLTLSFTAAANIIKTGTGSSAYCQVSATLDGDTWHSFFSTTATLAQTNYSLAVPAGTNLANVQLTVAVYPDVTQGSAANTVSASVVLSNLQIA